MDSARPLEIEPYSNRLFIHRLSSALLPPAIRIGIHPNFVTLAGFGFGVLAAIAYFQAETSGARLAWASAGFALMLMWLVMDGLDGQLARATGQTSDIGRLMDGVADYATFVAVNIALVIASPQPLAALGLALTAGAAHALQSQFYEGERATYIRRLAGRFTAIVRPQNGGFIERWHNRGEALLGNRTRPFDTCLALAGEEERNQLIAGWRKPAARTLLAASLLSSNGRVIAIWAAVAIGETMLYWIYEIFFLTLVALAASHKLRQAETGPIVS